MPWENASLLPPLVTIFGAALLGFLSAILLFQFLRRRRRTKAWHLPPGHPQAPERGEPDIEIEEMEGLFKDLPSLRPTPPDHPTPAEENLWQRAFDRIQDLLNILRGDHKSLCMIVWYPLDGRNRWQAQQGFNLLIQDIHYELDMDAHPLLREWVLEREQAYVTPLSADVHLREWEVLAHCRSGFWVPIRYFHRVDRLVLLAHPSNTYFQPHRARLITTALAIAALEGARMWYEDLLQRIKSQWVQWEKRLYRRLARQLHDGPAQTVAALAMEAGYLRLQSKRDPQAALANLKRLEELAREAAQEIRHLLFILRPVILEEEGLAAALHDLASKMNRLYRQQVILELSPEVLERIHPSVQTLLFYIAVEGLNNAAKHAQAETVWIRLRPDTRGDRFILEIEDNGKGFDPDQVLGNYTRRESLGLLTLQERVRRLGGRLEIHSAPGKGTRLVVYAPYELEPTAASEDETLEEAQRTTSGETPSSADSRAEAVAEATAAEGPKAEQGPADTSSSSSDSGAETSSS